MLVIVRFSLNGDDNGVFHRRLGKFFTDTGFAHNGTAEFTCNDVKPDVLYGIMSVFWEAVISNPPPGVTLDHFWQFTGASLPIDQESPPIYMK